MSAIAYIHFMDHPLRTVADIGAVIRARRTELGLSQAELAAMARVSRLWVNEVEQGKPNAGIGRMIRTFAALDLRLFASDEAPPPTSTSRRSSSADAIRTRLQQ